MVNQNTIIENSEESIYKGFMSLHLDGDYDTIEASTTSLYPRIGINKWCGYRADGLLDKIPGGDIYMDRTLNELIEMDMLDSLKELLSSEESKKEQDKQLKEDCYNYALDLVGVNEINNDDCRVYAGLWCPVDGEITIIRFLRSVYAKNVDLNNLDSINTLFAEEFHHYTTLMSSDQTLARSRAVYEYLKN